MKKSVETSHRPERTARGARLESFDRMQYAQRVILFAPPWNWPKLEAFVEKCIREQVILVCVVGDDCARVEDVIDELVVGSGSDDSRFLNTTSHPHKSIAEVREFAKAWTLNVDATALVQEVTL